MILMIPEFVDLDQSVVSEEAHSGHFKRRHVLWAGRAEKNGGAPFRRPSRQDSRKSRARRWIGAIEGIKPTGSRELFQSLGFGGTRVAVGQLRRSVLAHGEAVAHFQP